MNKGFLRPIFLSTFICAGFVSQSFAMKIPSLKLPLKSKAQPVQAINAELKLSQKKQLDLFCEACKERNVQKLDNCLETYSADLSFLRDLRALEAFFGVVEYEIRDNALTCESESSSAESDENSSAENDESDSTERDESYSTESEDDSSSDEENSEELFVGHALADSRITSVFLESRFFCEISFLKLCANKCLNMLKILFANEYVRKLLKKDFVNFAMTKMCEDKWIDGINFFITIKEFMVLLKRQVLTDHVVFLGQNLDRGRTIIRRNDPDKGLRGRTMQRRNDLYKTV